LSAGEHLEVVRRIHDAAAAGDYDAIFPHLHPEIVVHDHDLPDAGVFHGHAGYRRSDANWAASWDSYSRTDQEFVEVGDRVLALFTLRARGRDSGLEIERKDGIVYAFRDGLVSRVDYYDDQDQARAAAEGKVTSV
jgi:ketosteroid isomerase-like protein